MGEIRAVTPPYVGELSARVIRRGGKVEDLGVISSAAPPFSPRTVRRIQRVLHGLIWIGVAGLFGLLAWLFRWLYGLVLAFLVFAIVTDAGANYLAVDFAAGLSSPRISAMNFHDSGTGTTAAAVTDTALQTPTGGARVAGTQSNPATKQYKSVATISYTSSLSITEWGLFSASTSGTLWDRRVFTAIAVVSGDAIQFSYTLSVPSGGT